MTNKALEKIASSKLVISLAKKFPKTATALILYISSLSNIKEPKSIYEAREQLGDGYKEMVLGKNREPIKIISRPSNYDLVTIEEKQADGSWKTESKICEQVYNPKYN